MRFLRSHIRAIVVLAAAAALLAAFLHDVNFGRMSFLDQSAAARTDTAPSAERLTLHEARERFERDLILRTLTEQQGNMSRTAEALGVERSNLYRKMRAFGIAPARRVDEETEGV